MSAVISETAASFPSDESNVKPAGGSAKSPKLAAQAPKAEASSDAKASGDAKQAAPKLKAAAASREDNLVYDLKHLAAFDFSLMHSKADFDAYTRDTVQLLVNRVFALPRKETDVGPAAELPKSEVFKLPRQKPVPVIKPKTRWQQFMEDRNMRKRKRSRLVWDEGSSDWKPRWGYKSAKHSQETGQWFHEVKEGDDPTVNPFEKHDAKKKLLIARQKMREVRNRVEAAGGKMTASAPNLDTSASLKRGKEGLRETMKRAQISSASFGKFDRKAPNELPSTVRKQLKSVSASRSMGEEKERNLKTATRLLAGDGNVDKDKAAKVGAAQNEGKKQARAKPAYKRRSKQGGKKRR